MSTALVQSLDRGLALLQQLANADNGLTLQEVTQATGLKAPTAHNLLRTLTARGFAEKLDHPRRYRLGPAATQLAPRPNQTFSASLDRQLQRLHHDFPRARFSYTREIAGDLFAVRRIGEDTGGVLQRDAQQPMSPYRSASSLIHQAFWPAEQRQAFRRRYPFDEYAPPLWLTRADLEASLHVIRQQRIAQPVVPQDPHCRLAVPVFTPGGSFRGALGAYVHDPKPDQQAEHLAAALQASARALTPDA